MEVPSERTAAPTGSGLPAVSERFPGLPTVGLPAAAPRRHAPARTLRVSAGRVVRAVAGRGQRGVLRAGADPPVSHHAVEHDQDAQPPPPQHAGQRRAGHRAVRGAAG